MNDGFVARLSSLVAVAALTQGCVTAASLHDARVLPPGQFEFQATPAVYVGVPVVDGEDYPGVFGTFAVRGGVAPGLELGATLGPFQLRVDGKLELIDAESFVLAVSPALTAGGLILSEDGGASNLQSFFAADAMLIGTVVVGSNLGLTGFLGPGVGFIPPGEFAEAELALLARQGLGLRWQVGDYFALHPEVTITAEVANGYRIVDAAMAVGFVLTTGP